MLVRLTKSLIENHAVPPNRQVLIRDTELRGFGIRCGATTRTFFVETRVNGKPVRSSIGRYGVVTLDQARLRARQVLGDMAGGANPNILKRERRLESVTLQQASEDYLNERSLKPVTIRDYRIALNRFFAEWHHKPLGEISRDMVLKRYRRVVDAHGAAQANISFRFLRALYNYAMYRYERSHGCAVLVENPVNALSRLKLWVRIRPRTRWIQPHQLPAWWRAVQGLQNSPQHHDRETVRDLLTMLLCTGLRWTEASTLKWHSVDFAGGYILIEDPKNGIDHQLPLGSRLLRLLQTRRQEFLANASESYQLVFGFSQNQAQPLEAPRKSFARVIRQSGVMFSPHDLRRTFVSYANGLDISQYTLKRLMNHKSNDITGQYIQVSQDKLRRAMQMIEDYIVETAGIPFYARASEDRWMPYLQADGAIGETASPPQIGGTVWQLTED